MLSGFDSSPLKPTNAESFLERFLIDLIKKFPSLHLIFEKKQRLDIYLQSKEGNRLKVF